MSLEVLSITVSHLPESLPWMLHFSENQSHIGHKTFLFASEYVCLDMLQVIKLFFPVFKKRKVKNVTGVQSIIDLIHISVVDLGEISLPKRSWPH